jgi:voltage-gated sodium channel
MLKSKILTRLLLNEKFILLLILLNALIIFISGFETNHKINISLQLIDNLITGLFLTEILVKFGEYGVRNYFEENWNKFDFILICLSVPTLISFLGGFKIDSLSFLLVLRVLRIFKSLRFLKFIPGIDHLVNGLSRAFKASVFVLIGFAIYLFIIGIFSFYIFKEVSPEYFDTPLLSLYSIFKIFTIEGWYEIPESITVGLSITSSFLTYLYFIFVVFSGGIFGLSIVNSIFVDAMVSDNNDELEKKIELIDKKLDILIAKKTEL